MSIKNPPTFCSEDGDDYRAWKQDISVWRLCTKDEKKKHAAQVYLSLKGAAREAVRGIAHEDLVQLYCSASDQGDSCYLNSS